MIKILFLGNSFVDQFEDLPLEAETFKVNTVLDAQSVINQESFDFILGSFPSSDENWTAFVQRFVLAKNEGSYFHYLDKEQFYSLFVAEKENQLFVKVESRQLKAVHPIPCDVYLMISTHKYIRLIKAQSEFFLESLKHYEAKGMTSFYVRREDYIGLSKEIQKSLLSSLQGVEVIQETTLGDVAQLQAQNVLIVKEISQNLKIDSITLENLNDIVNSNVKFIFKSKGNLKNYFKSFLHAGPYLYGHSIMISHVANYVAMRMSWSTAKTMEKLSMAALLHDVALHDEKLARLDSLYERENSSLNDTDWEIYRRHTVLAYNLVSPQTGILPDVAQIILCHHETPDGTGFPRGLNATQISQIGCLFNITHFFVSYVYAKVWNKALIDEVIEEIKKRYHKGNYESFCEAFLKMLEEVEP